MVTHSSPASRSPFPGENFLSGAEAGAVQSSF
jgi:hypothetical protein